MKVTDNRAAGYQARIKNLPQGTVFEFSSGSNVAGFWLRTNRHYVAVNLETGNVLAPGFEDSFVSVVSATVVVE